MRELVPIKLDNAADASSSHAAVRMGVYTGALLVIVMMGALVAANRIPALERYALERNAISYSLFMLFMLLPVVRFWNSPMKMFGAAMIAWTLFVVAYDVAGMVFQNLFDSVRHTPLVALSEGTVVYGVLSVLSWVSGMILHARRDSMRPDRKAASETTRHSQ
jgi:hypothetical protein